MACVSKFFRGEGDRRARRQEARGRAPPRDDLSSRASLSARRPTALEFFISRRARTSRCGPPPASISARSTPPCSVWKDVSRRERSTRMDAKRTDARDFARRRGVADEDFLDASTRRLSRCFGAAPRRTRWPTRGVRCRATPRESPQPRYASASASEAKGRAGARCTRSVAGSTASSGRGATTTRRVTRGFAGGRRRRRGPLARWRRCAVARRTAPRSRPTAQLLTWGLASSSGELGHGGWTPIEARWCRAPSPAWRRRGWRKARRAPTTRWRFPRRAVSGRAAAGAHGQLGHGHFHDAGPLRRRDATQGMRVTHAVAGGAARCASPSAAGVVHGAIPRRHGQLGLGDVAFATAAGWETGVPWPCLVETLQDLDEPVVTLAAGGHHTLFVTAGGQLWGCGRGEHGALGVGVRGGHADYYYYEEDQRGAVRGPRDHLVPRLIPVHHKPAPVKSGGAARVAAGKIAGCVGQDHRSWWMAEAAVSAAPSPLDASARMRPRSCRGRASCPCSSPPRRSPPPRARRDASAVHARVLRRAGGASKYHPPAAAGAPERRRARSLRAARRLSPGAAGG